MSQMDNFFLQIRGRLRQLDIALWREPYYFDDIGIMEVKIDELADDFSQELGISRSKCKTILSELQEGALRKLAARQQFNETGIATFSVRRVNNREGTQSISEIKCSIHALGSELLELIAQKINVSDPTVLKCISAGKILDPKKTLESQGLKTNQNLMVVVSGTDNAEHNSREAMYDRIRKIKADVEAIVDSSRQLFEMEDQEGNPVFLPPEENRALLIAMGYCEKARAAMKRQEYDEALVLLLEADEKFTSCNSKFLESVDNYALVNMDIVWCYLCLKNVTQLPDAERRLNICEKSFHRSYGPDLSRLIALKGKACPERALIMRLHLLQGIVHFHQNERDAAYAKLELAGQELEELKVDDSSVSELVEMGYEPFEARLGLRACAGNMEQAINFIHERKEKLEETRRRTEKERMLNQRMTAEKSNANWVNPRSVCTLMEMGYARELVVEALKQTKNDVSRALDLLQTRADELRANLPPAKSADRIFLDQLKQLGFDEAIARVALETTHNNIDESIDFLLKLMNNEEALVQTIERITNVAQDSLPSTSTGASSSSTTIVKKVLKRAKAERESLKAYKRFNEGLANNDMDYLDLPLVQEEQLLAEYMRFLAQ